MVKNHTPELQAIPRVKIDGIGVLEKTLVLRNKCRLIENSSARIAQVFG